jgi:predicted nucleic acid-binding protein
MPLNYKLNQNVANFTPKKIFFNKSWQTYILIRNFLYKIFPFYFLKLLGCKNWPQNKTIDALSVVGLAKKALGLQIEGDLLATSFLFYCVLKDMAKAW